MEIPFTVVWVVITATLTVGLGVMIFLYAFERSDRHALQKSLDVEIQDHFAERRQAFALKRCLDREFMLLMRALSRLDSDFLTARLADGRRFGDLHRPGNHCLARLEQLIQLPSDNARKLAEKQRARDEIYYGAIDKLGTAQMTLSVALKALARIDSAARVFYQSWESLPPGEAKNVAWRLLADYLAHAAIEKE